MVKTDTHDWDHYLPMVQLAINYKIRSRTNSSPFSLMFARKINPIKEYGNNKSEQSTVESISLEKLNERVEHMSTIVFPAINERTQRILNLEQEKYNSQRKMVDIKEDTPVMVKLPFRPNKLAPIYEGPFVVVRKTQGGTYVLKDETNELLHREYTPLELKEVNIDETSIEDDIYEVEDIRAHRGQVGDYEYLVKWAGYGERANTWEPASSFTDPMTISKYWKKEQELKRLENKRREELVVTAKPPKKIVESAAENDLRRSKRFKRN